MKIAILDDYQDVVRQLPCFELLQSHEVKVFHSRAVGVGQLAIRLAPFEALVLIRERSAISKALLHRLPNLKLISQTGRAGPHIDLAAAAARGIAVLEGAGDPTAAAELTWALIMASSRKIVPYAVHLKEGLWQACSLRADRNTLGRALKGRTLGIWGYGKIGQLVAGYGRAFGMRVVIWGSAASRAQAGQDGYQTAISKESFFAESDIISLHLRLHEATRGIVDAACLGWMKTDALLVNTSRAELLEAGALELALERGRPGFAALDVFESEPLTAHHPLLSRENVLATPHLGYVEQDSYEQYFRAAFQNILDYVAASQSGHPNDHAL